MDIQDLLDEVEEAIQDRPSHKKTPSFPSSSSASYTSSNSSAPRHQDRPASSSSSKTMDDIDDILNMIDADNDGDDSTGAPVYPRRDSKNHTTTNSKAPEVTRRTEEFQVSSGTKKCSTLMVGGASTKRGVNTVFASHSVCGNLRCNDCDFTVVQFLHKSWSANADYMFFRENVPNETKLKARMDNAPGSAAYACQCKWLSIDVATRVDMCRVKWSCAGH